SNRKNFLFDEHYQQVHQDYSRFEEIEDEDGDPCDDINAIRAWVDDCFRKIINSKKYELRAINFSTYGASFVHIDRNGNPVAPLYNYLKPYPKKLLKQFHKAYGSPLDFAKATASPPLAMLNSGLQLYWLKHCKPKTFEKIRWSLHFPQYLSYLFTGVPLSEFTSIGCHTGLWDFAKQDYHEWVYAEGIDQILPPIVPTSLSINRSFDKQKIKIGVGIHDSSSALLPYLRADKNPFMLISTGTWSISLNPFNNKVLTSKDLKNDCLNFLRIDGKAVKAARLFLGNEYKIQVKKLHQHFGKKYGYHRKMKFDESLAARLQKDPENKFRFESIQLKRKQPKATQLSNFPDFKTAFHQLMLELTALQIAACKRAIGKTDIRKIYIDGGFADNDVYVQLLSRHFDNYKIRTTQSPLGSALGAALAIADERIGKSFLKEHYAMRKA
ncbi:MAG: FGGY family carbohydrate kinase, partial [Bacteroidota bacterium]